MEQLRVEISYGDVRASFTGSPEEVAELVNRFLAQSLPTFDLAKKLYLNYNLKELTEMFSDFVRITPEGPRVVAEGKLSDKLKIALQLVGARLAYETGKKSTDTMSIEEIESATGINPKSISSRLSEMVKVGYAERLSDKKGTAYRITTMGIRWLAKTVKKH